MRALNSFKLSIVGKSLNEFDVIENALKPDKLAYIKRYPLYRKAGKRIYTTASSLQQEQIFTHQLSILMMFHCLIHI